MGVRRHRTLLVVCCVWLLGACGSPPVVRVVDGTPLIGPFVSAAAYAAYARGAEAEARGRMQEAQYAYRAATEEDDDSSELWTRLAAVSCALGHDPVVERAFSQAAERDQDYQPLWHERARCAERRGRYESGYRAAVRAVDLDPDRIESTLLLLRLAARTKQFEVVDRRLDALMVEHPDSAAVWSAVRRYAAVRESARWVAIAENRLSRLGHGDPEETGELRAAWWRGVDAALLSDDLAGARRVARRARLRAGYLAVRAIVLGKPALAQAAAGLRLRAEPRNSDARITLALAMDLSGKAEQMSAVMAELPKDVDAVGPLGRLMMAELLARHVGEREAKPWLKYPGQSKSDADLAMLERQLRQRVEQRTGGQP